MTWWDDDLLCRNHEDQDGGEREKRRTLRCELAGGSSGLVDMKSARVRWRQLIGANERLSISNDEMIVVPSSITGDHWQTTGSH